MFKIDCYENADGFGYLWLSDENEARAGRPPGSSRQRFLDADLRFVAAFEVEADSSEGAADQGFHIGNAPEEPVDVNGKRWLHRGLDAYRSMSSGDVVVVHTPDGPVAYGCLSFGWMALPPELVARLARPEVTA